MGKYGMKQIGTKRMEQLCQMPSFEILSVTHVQCNHSKITLACKAHVNLI